MAIFVPGFETSTQAVVIKTDVQVLYSTILCPFTVTSLTPPAAYISLSANKVSINAALISFPGNFGVYPFTITVISSNFFGAVAQKSYNFNLVINCAVTSLAITSQASNTTYTLNKGSFVTAPFTVV